MRESATEQNVLDPKIDIEQRFFLHRGKITSGWRLVFKKPTLNPKAFIGSVSVRWFWWQRNSMKWWIAKRVAVWIVPIVISARWNACIFIVSWKIKVVGSMKPAPLSLGWTKNWKTSPCLMKRMMISKIPNGAWSIEDEDKTVEGNGRKSN